MCSTSHLCFGYGGRGATEDRVQAHLDHCAVFESYMLEVKPRSILRLQVSDGEGRDRGLMADVPEFGVPSSTLQSTHERLKL